MFSGRMEIVGNNYIENVIKRNILSIVKFQRIDTDNNF